MTHVVQFQKFFLHQKQNSDSSTIFTDIVDIFIISHPTEIEFLWANFSFFYSIFEGQM